MVSKCGISYLPQMKTTHVLLLEGDGRNFPSTNMFLLREVTIFDAIGRSLAALLHLRIKVNQSNRIRHDDVPGKHQLPATPHRYYVCDRDSVLSRTNAYLITDIYLPL